MKKVTSVLMLGTSILFMISSCQKEDPLIEAVSIKDETLESRACSVSIDPPEYVGNCTYWVSGTHPDNTCQLIRVIVSKGSQVIKDEIVGNEGLYFSIVGCNGGGNITITKNWGAVPGNTRCNCSNAASFGIPNCGFETSGPMQIHAGQDANCKYFLYTSYNSNIFWAPEFFWVIRRGSFNFYSYSRNPSPGKMLGLIPEPDEICYYRIGSYTPGGSCQLFYTCIDYLGGNPDCN